MWDREIFSKEELLEMIRVVNKEMKLQKKGGS
jgi:hypothetical protein